MSQKRTPWTVRLSPKRQVPQPWPSEQGNDAGNALLLSCDHTSKRNPYITGSSLQHPVQRHAAPAMNAFVMAALYINQIAKHLQGRGDLPGTDQRSTKGLSGPGSDFRSPGRSGATAAPARVNADSAECV